MRRIDILRLLPLSLTFALLLTAELATAGIARAQGPIPLEEFSTARYFPAPGRGNYLGIDGARLSGHLTPSFALHLDYAHNPFTLSGTVCPTSDPASCEPAPREFQLVKYTATANFTFALTLYQRLQIGLVLPIAITSGEGFAFTQDAIPVQLEGGTSPGIGDVRLHLKGMIFGEAEGPAFAVAAFMSAPFGQLTADGRYLGDYGPTIGGHFIADLNQGPFRGAINLGFLWRESGVTFGTEVGGQITYGGALSFDFTPRWGALVELQGGSSFGTEESESPLEGRLASRFTFDDWSFHLGGGASLIEGVGTPTFRVLGGIAYAQTRGDSDEDGIDDRLDSCPADAEDRDEFQDEDGCPESDNDQDSIPDADDRCPDQAEDVDEVDDTDGCPDIDNDNDGVQDGYDSCPAEPEDMDGDRDQDGCPDNDRDRDNIDDSRDQCPDEPEDTDGYGDDDGCAETDFDSDGLPDDGDQCPDQAEDTDGFEDDDGCPEDGGPPPSARGRRR